MSRKTIPRETEKPKKLTRAQKKEIDAVLRKYKGDGNGFLGDFFLQYESLLVAENSERQLGWNHQPPQVKGSHGWTLLSVRCWAGGPNQAAPYHVPQGTHSSC